MSIPDFMATMSDYTKLEVETLVGVRRTEDPVRMSVYDVIQTVTGQPNPRVIFSRFCEAFPEVVTQTANFKFE